MEKNPTPLRIALLSALTVAASFCLLLLWLQAFGVMTDVKPAGYLISFSVLFFLVLVLTLWGLEYYVYRKSKVIYKMIYKIKMQTADDMHINLAAPIFADVEQDVHEWAEHHAKELAEMRRLEQFRREFVGNIAHELKTPVFNIEGYLDTLVEGAAKDEVVREDYLRRALRNVDRLNAILNDLDTIAQFENEQARLQIDRFDIYELTLQIFKDLEIKAQQKNINLSVKDGCRGSFYVKADKQRIEQVLLNLINNSISYGNDNGHTQISFYDLDNKTALIEVSDDGIGIEEKNLNRLFERFYRVDSSRSRDTGGTGLGLAIVKHFIEAHQQTIHVRSTYGIGSTFGFTLRKG